MVGGLGARETCTIDFMLFFVSDLISKVGQIKRHVKLYRHGWEICPLF